MVKINRKPLDDDKIDFSVVESIGLNDDEYLLKIKEPNEFDKTKTPTGFLTKLTQKKKVPKSFLEWGTYYSKTRELDTFIVKEEFKSGWEFKTFRWGKSQSWAVLKHPNGFLVEIYSQKFEELIINNKIVNGVIEGEFKWEYSKLIKNK